MVLAAPIALTRFTSILRMNINVSFVGRLLMARDVRIVQLNITGTGMVQASVSGAAHHPLGQVVRIIQPNITSANAY